MKTLPTINSHNFKGIMCPTCEKSPKRHGKDRVPVIIFKGIRWVADYRVLEFQGHCEHCYKEWRIQIDGFALSKTHPELFNPKISKTVGPIEDHLRRFGI